MLFKISVHCTTSTECWFDPALQGEFLIPATDHSDDVLSSIRYDKVCSFATEVLLIKFPGGEKYHSEKDLSFRLPFTVVRVTKAMQMEK